MQVDCIKAYLVFRKTPKELETRLARSISWRRKKTDQTIEQDCLRTINWFQYLWDNNQSGDEQEILSVLPVKVSENEICEGVQQFSWLRSIPNKSQSEKILCLSCRQRSLCTSTLKLWRRFGCSRWQMFWLHKDVCRLNCSKFWEHYLNIRIGLWKRSPWRTGSQVEAGGWNRYENILFIIHIR